MGPKKSRQIPAPNFPPPKKNITDELLQERSNSRLKAGKWIEGGSFFGRESGSNTRRNPHVNPRMDIDKPYLSFLSMVVWISLVTICL